MCEGVSATAIPASSIASTLAAAVPLPPETMAPAWPMRLPGGAVMPAMKAATGLSTMFFGVGSGFFFRGTLDFADHDDSLGLRILVEEFYAVQMVGSVDRISTDSNAGRLTVSGEVICQTAS